MPSNMPKSLHEFLDYINAGKPAKTVAEVRKALQAMGQKLSLPKQPLPFIEDRECPAGTHTIPVRIYHPAPEQALPLLIYYHGGGHMCGDLESHDASCRRIAKACHCVVMAVDYRLTPDFPYPAGLDDCISAFENRAQVLAGIWVATDKVILAGDSAGGNMAISVCHHAKQQQDKAIKALVLIYPGTDFTLQHESITRYGTGYMITKEKIDWYFDHYLPDPADRRKASPLYFEHLDWLPPTYVAVAEFDPLHDEGVAFAEKLEQLGVPVTLEVFHGMIHSFMLLEKVVPRQVDQLILAIGTFVRNHFHV